MGGGGGDAPPRRAFGAGELAARPRRRSRRPHDLRLFRIAAIRALFMRKIILITLLM